MKKLILIFLIIFLGVSGYYVYLNYLNQKSLPGSTTPINQNVEIKTEQDIAIFLENLDVPWEIAFIDNETLLVTERKGNLLLIKNQKIINSFPITETSQSGEGGLLGIAIHPKFK
jgi:glucose/arabinose dehydrogenase